MEMLANENYFVGSREPEELLAFLWKIERGYEPTEEELLELSKITAIYGRGHLNIDPFDTIPKAIQLLPNLIFLELRVTNLRNIDALSVLTNLQELDLSDTDVTDISPLAFLVNLKKLYLGGTDITDINALSGLTNLENLDLSFTEITDVAALSALKKLRQLDLSETEITGITALSGMKNLQELYLTNTDISDISPLASLVNLRKLYLGGTSITDVSALSALVNIERLELDCTEVTDITPLSTLVSLQELDLSNSHIKKIDALSSLVNLCELDLSDSDITDVQALSSLVNLQELRLRSTQIQNLNGLSSLKKLLNLNLGGSQVAELNALQDLHQLESLYLWDTQITTLQDIASLSEIRELSCWGTAINSIESLSKMKKLEWLDISHTQIHSLPQWLGERECLRQIDLSGLHLHSIPAELLRLDIPFEFEDPGPFGAGIVLENTTLAAQPISLFEQPRELIKAYYEGTQIPVNEAKVIFLGDGGAGKTHTIQRIHNNGKQDRYETETTPGIDITNYTADHNGRRFNIHFWDFGGQEIMHAMHRCFLTDRTCYVVVVSNRWDLNSRARYWLKNIDSFAKGAPVILAVNRWDNIQETGIDMNRLTKDYPNLVKQPVYYSAKDSTEYEFRQLIDAIIREAGKLDSTAMSFPAQWAAIRQQLLDMAEHRYYIDKEEYHRICDEQGLDSSQIRTWLLEWFNDLGVCFSYHQDEAAKSEMAAYKVLNPRWLTNAIYIIINAGYRYADKGRLSLNLIQDLLQRSELGVLTNVTYTEDERDYVLDVMRKFNLSYAVSENQEFIPALCDSETPQCLHPQGYAKQVSYQMEYSYLPDSVVHQLMIRCYQNLNPEKIWRKGLRIDLDWLGLSAVVDMGSDDATLRIDVYSNGSVEPWKLLNNIRADIAAINSSLGLSAKEYLIIHADGGDIPVTVDQLLDALEQRLDPMPIHNPFSRKWELYSADELLGMTFGKEVVAATIKKATEDEQSLTDAFRSVKIENINFYPQFPQPDAYRIIEYLIKHQCEMNEKLMECLMNALDATGNEDAKELAEKMKQDQKERKNPLKRLAEYVKSGAEIVTGGKTIYGGAKAVIRGLQAAYPVIQEHIPDIIEFFQGLPLGM